MLLHMGHIDLILPAFKSIISARWARQYINSMGISLSFTRLAGQLQHGIILDGVAYGTKLACIFMVKGITDASWAR